MLFLIFYGKIQYDEIGSPLFFSPRSSQKASHTLPFVGCGCPVDTSAKQKHRPKRQLRLLFAFGKFTESFLPAVTGKHRGGLFRPLALWFLVQSDSDSRDFFRSSPRIIACYFAKSIESASKFIKLVKISQKGCACICYKNCG